LERGIPVTPSHFIVDVMPYGSMRLGEPECLGSSRRASERSVLVSRCSLLNAGFLSSSTLGLFDDKCHLCPSVLRRMEMDMYDTDQILILLSG
jgi:hypothetical protein